MNKKLRIFLCSLLSVVMIFALAIAGCSTTTTTSTGSDSTSVSDSTGSESTGSESTGSGDTSGETTHVHSYDYANYTIEWSEDGTEATVTVACECGDTQSVTATVTPEVKTAATNTAKGLTTYTASFSLNGVDYTIPVDVDTPALATVYDTYYIDNVESKVEEGTELFDGFATTTGSFYWSNSQSVTISNCAIADGYVFQGRLYNSGSSGAATITFTLEEAATVTIYATINYSYSTTITDKDGETVFSSISTSDDYTELKELEVDLTAGTYTINCPKGAATGIYAIMLQDSGNTSAYTDGLWQPTAEEEPETPDEPVDEDVSSVPEALALGDNTITVSAKDSSGEGEEVTSTFTAEEAGTYTFSISADEDGYVYVGDRTRTLSASGTTTVDVEMTEGQIITLTFFTDSMETATYTLNISSTAIASGTFDLETETDYTFTAPIAGTYTFTLISGDTSYAVIYNGKASYDAYGTAIYDAQSDGTSFQLTLAENEQVTFYLSGSDGVTVSYTTGSATSGGETPDEPGTVTETVIPALAAGDNAISVTASDAATLSGTAAGGYVSCYGASATYTAPENGYYTFSIGASDEYAYVIVVYGTASNEYYKLSSTSTTTTEAYANGIYLEKDATVTVYFSTDDGYGNFVAASYTFTISYVAGTSSLVYPTELTIGGTTEVVMDNSKYVDIYGTTTADGVYTISIPTYDDLSEVAIAIYLNDVHYVTLDASNNYTVEFEATSGTSINFYARISSDSSAVASYTISVTYVEQEIEIYSLTVNAYVLGSTTSALTATDGYATGVAIAEGKSIYLKAATPRPTYDYNFVLTISDLTNLTILASTEKDSSDSTMAADGSYTIAINASAFTANSDGTYSYSFTLNANSQVYFMVTASANVTIDVSIVYGGEGGTLGGDTSGDEDTNTYVELTANTTTNITWGGEEYAYVVYYTYTAAGATTATLALNGSHDFFSNSSMVSYLDITVTLNGETVTGTSKILYTLNLVKGENKIVISFAAGSSMIADCTALLTVEETEVDPTEGYTVLTANKTTEFTWDGESTAYTASFCYYATEAVEATLTISSDQSMFSNTSMISYISMTATLNGDALTGTTPISYTFNLAAGYNYIVISFAGANTMVDGYTYTVKLACEDASHVHTYTDATWVWSDDYSSATLTLACTGCDETVTYTVDSTNQVTQEATCTTYGEKVYTVTYTYGDNTYTDTKTVSTPYAHSLTHYDAVAATLTTDGNIEYWYCSECGKYFSDAEGETEITAADIVVKYDTSNTLYNMSATGLTTASSDYLYPVGSSYEDTYATSIFDGTFTVVTTATSVSSLTRLTYKSVTDSVQDNTVTGYTDDNSTTLDTTAAINYFTYQKALSFTLTQSATITIWYGLVNSSYPLYISTDMSSSTNIKNSAVATFEINANVTSYASTYYKCVSQGSVTLAAGTYYITTTATSSGNGPYVYAIAIDYDLSGVTISGDTEVTAGNSITLTAAATLADGSASSEAIVWTTSDSNIATVDNGVVTGVAAGTVTITATAGNVSATYTITVTEPVYVKEVTVTGDTTVTVGGTLTLTEAVTMSDGSAFTGTVTWATSDSSIATVENGVVTAIAAGEVTITATTDGVIGSITITVEKAPAAAMTPGEAYTVDLTTTDSYVETSITITEAGYYTVTVSAEAIISISDSSYTYYYNSTNCYLGYIIDYAAADETPIKVEAGTILTVYISLVDSDTPATVTATIALDPDYTEGDSGDSGDSGEVTASGSFELADADYTFTATVAGTYTFTITGDTEYASIWAGEDEYNNSWTPTYLDVQSSGTTTFTVELSAGQSIVLYCAGSDGVTVAWSVVASAAASTTVYNISDYTIASSVTEDTEIEDDDLVTITVESGCAYVELTNTNTDLEVDDGVDLTGYVGVGSSTGVVLTLKSDATVTIYYSSRKTTVEVGIYNSSNELVESYATTSATYNYVLKATVELAAGTYTILGVSGSVALWSIIVAPSTSSGEETSGSFELADADYTFTATVAGTYTFTITGDTEYASIWAGEDEYNNSWTPTYLDVQSSGTTTFTVELSAGQSIVLYCAGSDGVTVAWSVGTSGNDDGGETDVSVVPTLVIGDNTIYITAADSKADGVTVTFTAADAGDYTFSATGDAWVEVGAYKATVSGSVSQPLTLTEGEVVTITFYTYSYDAATYTFTIAYTAAETTSYTLTSDGGTYTLAKDDEISLVVSESGTYTFTVDADGYVKLLSDGTGSALATATYIGDNYIGYTTVILYEGETITVTAEYASTLTVTYSGIDATVNIGDLVTAETLSVASYSEETTLYSGSDGTSVAVTASSSKTVSVDSNSKSYTVTDEEGNSSTEFTSAYRLKLGGSGASDGSSRCVEITTVGACTITVYMMSSSSTEGEERTVTLSQGTTDEDGTTTLSTLTTTEDVGGSSLVKVTYTVSEAGTYYLASTSGGLNVYGVIITYTAE